MPIRRLLLGLAACTAATALFLAAPAIAKAATLSAYVGGGASSPSSCPQTATVSEQCTLAQALGLAAAGDTVLLETPGSTAHYRGNWNVSTPGTSAGSPLTIMGNAELTSLPVLDGNLGLASECETATCDSSILTITAANVAIDYLEFEGARKADEGALPASGGGAIEFVGTNEPSDELTVSHSTFTDNRAKGGGAIAKTGRGELEVTDSTFVENVATFGPGGAIDNADNTDGSNSATGPLLVARSTFYENSTPLSFGGAISNSFGDGSGTATIVASTFSNDPAKTYTASDINNGGPGILKVAGNLFASGSCFHNQPGTWHDLGFNASTDANTSCIGFANGDVTSPDVATKLGPLQDNGGPTETIAPTVGNPALGLIEAGAEADLIELCPTTDQRGVANPGSAGCDAGAVQNGQSIRFTSEPPLPAITGESYEPTTTSGASGNPVTMTIDPSSTPGACNISGEPGEYTVTFDGVGRCTINAEQAGDENFLPGSTQQTFQIRFSPGIDLYAYAGGGATDPVECQPTATVSEQCTLTQALGLAGPQDTVLLGTPGSEAHYRGTWDAPPFVTPLTIEAAPGLPSMPVLDGNEGEVAGCETDRCDSSILEVEGDDAEIELSINGVAFENSYESSSGGAIWAEQSTLDISASHFAGNVSEWGGAIYLEEAAATVSSSTFTGNAAREGGAIYVEEGTLGASNSTFSGNTATEYGGGAILNEFGTIGISNSTFSGNSAPTGPGGAIDNADWETEGTLNVRSSTFSGNNAEIGDAIASSAKSGTEGVVNAAGNLFAEGCDRGGGTWNDAGYSAVADASCVNGGPGNVVSPEVAAKLGALGDNGGPTETIMPLPGNPAVGLVPEGTAVSLGEDEIELCPRTDQRGQGSIDGVACAAGAVQVSPPGPPTSPAATPGFHQASFTWGPPENDGGSPLTGYEVSCDPSGTATTDAETTEAMIEGLAGNTFYECGITASNAYGTSPPAETSVETEGLIEQAVEFTSNPPSPAIEGGDYEPTATGGESGNPVTMAVGSGSTPGACAISEPEPGEFLVSFEAAGKCVIEANQAGNSEYEPGFAEQEFQILTTPGTDLFAYAAGGATDPSSCPETATVANQCTLTQALDLTGPGSTVVLATSGSEAHYVGNWETATPGTSAASPLTIEADPNLSSSPVLDGNEGEASGCETPACDGAVLELAGETHVAVSGVTFEGGKNESTEAGGAIENAEGGVVTVSDSRFAGNFAAYGAAIYSLGSEVTVTGSSFRENTGFYGPAIYGEGSTVSVSSSSFTENAAESEGGAIFGFDDTEVDVSASTFSGNTAVGSGGALWGEGTTLAVHSSTFSENTAENGVGGAIANASGFGGGTLDVSASTFSGNTALQAGDAIANSTSGTAGVVNAAGNLFAEGCEQGDGTWNDLGYNASVDATCLNGGPSNATSAAVASALGALADNGGPSETILPLPSNPAIGLIPNATSVTLGGGELTLCPRTDQRGSQSVAGLACAAGAVQVGPPGPPTTPSATPGVNEADFAWSAPAADGGSPLTGYDVSCDPSGSASVGAGTTSTSIVGLSGGTLYECEITASNAYGSSMPAEVSVTPTIPAPVVTALNPTSGPTAGGNQVEITGTDLGSATKVEFGTTVVEAPFAENTATTIKLDAPAHAAGIVDVTVSTAGGTSATGAATKYTYEAPTQETPEQRPATQKSGSGEPTPQTPTPPLDTRLTAKAKIVATKHKAKFWFAASGNYSGYECALIRKGKGRRTAADRRRRRFRPCRSPRTYKHLKAGKYVFKVRAVGPAGVDKSPATRRFRIG